MFPRIESTGRRPCIVAVGGSLNESSSTQKALQLLLDHAAEAGCETCLIAGRALDLPFYGSRPGERTDGARSLGPTAQRRWAVHWLPGVSRLDFGRCEECA